MDDLTLIAHVHVPKTAGTAINGVLHAALGPGRHHVEGIIDDKAAFAEAARQHRWVAGHVPTPKLRTALTELGLSATYITALREPVSHVASHYNWLIEIGHRGEGFLKGHPEAIQALHKKIASTDNTNPRAVMKNLAQHAGLFLNAQAKHVIGAGYSDPHISFADALSAFSEVFLPGPSSSPALRVFPNVPMEARNVARMHFDRGVFDEPELRSFLRDRNRFDEALWLVAQDVEQKRSEREKNA